MLGLINQENAMKRPAKKVNDGNDCVRMGLTSDDIKTLYYSNEKYVREMIEVCAQMAEKERLIMLSIAKTLAIITPDTEEVVKPAVTHRKRDLRDSDHMTYLHGVA
jgi:hypothetical protein